LLAVIRCSGLIGCARGYSRAQKTAWGGARAAAAPATEASDGQDGEFAVTADRGLGGSHLMAEVSSRLGSQGGWTRHRWSEEIQARIVEFPARSRRKWRAATASRRSICPLGARTADGLDGRLPPRRDHRDRRRGYRRQHRRGRASRRTAMAARLRRCRRRPDAPGGDSVWPMTQRNSCPDIGSVWEMTGLRIPSMRDDFAATPAARGGVQTR